MTFDFSFDLSVLEQASTTGEAHHVEEQASLSLLKRFLQNSNSPQMAHWQHLQQQLVDVFLPYMALFDADNWWSYQSFSNASMLEIKQQLLYKDQAPKKRLQLPHSLSIAVWQDILRTMKISEHLVGADVDDVQHLAILCASLPCQVGYAEVCSIAALNCFEVRTELQISDLVHMAAMLSGTDDVKMDLAQLVTLDIGLPSWSWTDVVLQCELADTENSKLSLKQLEKQLTAQHLKPANDPATDLLALFALAQQIGQQKIQHTRQLLSSLTHVLLDEDVLSPDQLQLTTALQKKMRQDVGDLQNNLQQMVLFCQQFEKDLQVLCPVILKNQGDWQVKTLERRVQTWESAEKESEKLSTPIPVTKQKKATEPSRPSPPVAPNASPATKRKKAVEPSRPSPPAVPKASPATKRKKAVEPLSRPSPPVAPNASPATKRKKAVEPSRPSSPAVPNASPATKRKKAVEPSLPSPPVTPDTLIQSSVVWYDSSTNLTWMRCSLGQTWDGKTCIGTAEKYTWDAAHKAVAAMNRNGGYAGYTDWVVPDLDALKSLLCHVKNGSQINKKIFPNTPAQLYWSASPLTSRNTSAWLVDFGSYLSYSRGKGDNNHVRAVRAGR